MLKQINSDEGAGPLPGHLVPRRRVRSPVKMERMSLPKEAALTGSSFCSWQWRT